MMGKKIGPPKRGYIKKLSIQTLKRINKPALKKEYTPRIRTK